MTLVQDKSQKSITRSISIEASKDLGYATLASEDFGLGQRFFNNLGNYKDSINQVDAVNGVTETNGSLLERSIQIAVEMQTREVNEQDTIIICSKTHVDQTVVFLAGLLIGCIVSPIDPEISTDELKSFVSLIKPKMIFCDLRISKELESIYRDLPSLPLSSIVVFGSHTDRLTFEKMLHQVVHSNFQVTPITHTKTKAAFIVATQGTNGVSKLVRISHRAMLIQITKHASTILEASTKKILSYFPLSWITQIMITCYCLENSIMRIFPGEFNERAACRLIHDLKIDTAFLGTEYATKIVRYSVQDFDISALKNVYVGGILTTAYDMASLRSGFSKARVHQCYGLTELSGIVAAFSIENYQKALRKPGSVGNPFPNVKVKIVDVKTRQPLGPNVWGELLLGGSTLMMGYFKDGRKSRDSIIDGYFKTGDMAQLDSDGCLYIQGRISDHIITDKGKFIPALTEEMILEHPEVLEVVILGDSEDIVACVIKKEGSELTTEQLMKFIQKTIPEKKRPTKVKFMSSFPKTSVGKIKKHLIKHTLGVTIVQSKSIVSLASSFSGSRRGSRKQ